MRVDGLQDALDPKGPQAGAIAELFWTYVGVTSAVWALVVIALAWAVFRPKDPTNADREHRLHASIRHRAGTVVGIAIGASAVVLVFLLVASVRTGKAVASLDTTGALVVKVKAHQWWWDVVYEDPVPYRKVRTANEIHLPVGRPVVVHLESADVIHSFWVPNLHGKRDLIPGMPSETVLRADEPGVYRGQCGEFCGHQHANMALQVVVESPEEFQRWYEHQLEPARPPVTEEQKRGQRVFLEGPCVMCHAIAGTPAGGTVAPDLTHFASRRTIAAGTLANTRGHLAGWITNAQGVKPGNRMPSVSLPARDLHDLLAYLESLE